MCDIRGLYLLILLFLDWHRGQPVRKHRFGTLDLDWTLYLLFHQSVISLHTLDQLCYPSARNAFKSHTFALFLVSDVVFLRTNETHTSIASIRMHFYSWMSVIRHCQIWLANIRKAPRPVEPAITFGLFFIGIFEIRNTMSSVQVCYNHPIKRLSSYSITRMIFGTQMLHTWTLSVQWCHSAWHLHRGWFIGLIVRLRKWKRAMRETA